MAWLVVNGNGKFRIFKDYHYPQRKEIEETTIDTSTYVECSTDYHRSGFCHPEIPTGNIIKMWESGKDWGIPIDKTNLSKELQSRTWEDEPIKI